MKDPVKNGDDGKKPWQNLFLFVAFSSILAFLLGAMARNIMMQHSGTLEFFFHRSPEKTNQVKISSSRQFNHIQTGNNVPPVEVSMDGSSVNIYEARFPHLTNTFSISKSSSESYPIDYKRKDPFMDIIREDEAYYESVVHPAMMINLDIAKVAIIGGGKEGVVLREVLKYRYVERVIAFDVDRKIVEESRANPSPRNYCGDIEGSALSCFDDPRVQLISEDVVTWFIQNHSWSKNEGIDEKEQEDDDGENEDVDKDDDDNEEDEDNDEDDDDENNVENDDDDKEGNEDDEKECSNIVEANKESDYDELDDVEKMAEKQKEIFDIIIATPTDPKNETSFAHALYKNKKFQVALSDAVGYWGSLVIAQVGEKASTFASKREFSVGKIVDDFAKDDDGNGWFESFHVYDEVHPEMGSKWATAIACKKVFCRELWQNDAPMVDRLLHYLILPSKFPLSSLLRYFDGATMMRYQVPQKEFETTFCIDEQESVLCRHHRGIRQDLKYVPLRDLEVKNSTIGAAGLGLFTKVDIKAGSAIALDQSLDPAYFRPSSVNILENRNLISEEHPVFQYADFYGYDGVATSNQAVFVEASVLSFANHGCKGSYNLVAPDDTEDKPEDGVKYTEMHEYSADVRNVYEGQFENDVGFGYNPVIERHLVSIDNRMDVTRHDIKAGEELFSNYLPYANTLADWERNLQKLRNV